MCQPCTLIHTYLKSQQTLRMYHGGKGVDEGGGDTWYGKWYPMSRIEFKKCQCPLSLFVHSPC